MTLLNLHWYKENPPFSSSSKTDVGEIRSENQDFVLIDDEYALFLLADGMGGHLGGKVASSLAVREAHSYLRENLSISAIPRITQSIKCAHNKVLAKGDSPDTRNMGTTLEIGLIEGSFFYWGHVGDSRIYLARENQCFQITKDDTLAFTLVQQGLLTEEQAKSAHLNSRLTNTVGADPHLRISTGSFTIQKGDRILISSDGLHDVIPAQSLRRSLTDFPPNEALGRMIDEANSKGGPDNISGIIIEIDG